MWIFGVLLWCHFFVCGIKAERDICLENPIILCQGDDSLLRFLFLERFPTEREIKEMCPSAVVYINCLKEYKENCGSLEGTALPSAETFVKMQNVISEICNENSLLYEAYVTNGDCLVALNDKLSTCEDKARSVFVAYEEFQSKAVRERDDPYKGNNGLCVTKFYTIYCLSLHVQANCSQEAHDGFKELTRRLDPTQTFCSFLDIYDLQTRFAQFLQQRKDNETVLQVT
ncbi:uncharacterized protein LOC118189277 [Stegodyphus dumicola]|uniref:uncharacterized protein LOC118189277 n=1 Tax=Stegodyphus dumicola TaxID=202533 RepID=UPI0015A90CA3|nr:uncharacterized protein LOC118189277 [Stegodyphus dumicola]